MSGTEVLSLILETPFFSLWINAEETKVMVVYNCSQGSWDAILPWQGLLNCVQALLEQTDTQSWAW